MLKEIAPRISRVGVLWVAPSSATSAWFYYEAAARAQKIPLQSLEVHGPTADLDGAFREAAKARVDALIVATNQALSPRREKLAELAIKNRLPSMFEQSVYVEAGGLVSYSANDDELFDRAAVFVDKILKGRKPSDLPVEQPMKFDFVINLKTAKLFGLNVAQSVLFRADKVFQ